MSGLTPTCIYDFRKALQARGSSVTELAKAAGVTRKHLSLILWGHFEGGNYWARVRACVTAREWDMLLKMPHIAAWAQRAAARPAPFAVRWVCGECGTGLGFRAAAADTPPGLMRAGMCPLCAEKIRITEGRKDGGLSPDS